MPSNRLVVVPFIIARYGRAICIVRLIKQGNEDVCDAIPQGARWPKHCARCWSRGPLVKQIAEGRREDNALGLRNITEIVGLCILLMRARRSGRRIRLAVKRCGLLWRLLGTRTRTSGAADVSAIVAVLRRQQGIHRRARHAHFEDNCWCSE